MQPKNNAPTTQPTELDCAYAAGIVDGEGNISIRKKALRKGRRMRDIHTEIIITMTDRPVLAWLQERWGGGILKQNRSEKHAHWQDIYRWNLYSARAATFLKSILPYMIAKRPQAELGIEFQEFLASWATKRYHAYQKGFQSLPDGVLEKREEYHFRMKVLNLMGHGFDEREAIQKLIDQRNQALATGLSTDEIDAEESSEEDSEEIDE